ncbi:hypothetical protein Leryth_007549 [Lithospermum erythrorhizon]|nr:hypothetical protein Leryth_007549 [Lithospermum erythrorhizon]
MNGDESGEKELPPDEQKKVKDANVGDGQSSLNDDEFKINGEINIGQKIGQGSWQSQPQQQQSHGTPFCWEKFLHIRTIKVLLVEYDNCTRHVVAALLRNCNYEVIEVSNGLQAWKVLEDLTNHVDLILSEVVTPCVSGVGLLCKIMSHKSRKNIPIIMMSSLDSMGLVFKCLTKGAVDFLVKPIRKNELKNLWQHVWRRCHSSSGSGSESERESGSQTQKFINSKSSEKPVNHSVNNDKEDDGNDHGSGAQGSWSSQEASECEDSTCAQVIYPNAEAAAIKQPELHGLVACKTVKLEVKPDAIEAANSHIGAQQNVPLEIDPSINGNMKDECLEFPKGDYQSMDHQVVCTITSGPEVEFNRSGSFLEHTYRLDKMNNTPKNHGKPTVDLSLKSLKGVQEAGIGLEDDYNSLRNSEVSASLRYNASTAFRTPNGIDIIGSASVEDKSLDSGKKELEFDIPFNSYDSSLLPSSKRGSKIIDIASTTYKLLPTPLIVLSEEHITIHHVATLIFTMEEMHAVTQQENVVKQSNRQSATLFAPARGSHQQLPIQHPHHHHHHHYHINHFHNFESGKKMSNNEELSLKKLSADAPHRGKSNVPGDPGKATPLYMIVFHKNTWK